MIGRLQVAGVVEPAKVVGDGRRAYVRVPRLDLVERQLAIAVRVVETVELLDRRLGVAEDRRVLAERPCRACRRPPVLGPRRPPDIEGQPAHLRRHGVDVEQRLELRRRQRRAERGGDRIPVRVGGAGGDDVVDARREHVEVAHEPRIRSHPFEVRRDAIPRDAAVVLARDSPRPSSWCCGRRWSRPPCTCAAA